MSRITRTPTTAQGRTNTPESARPQPAAQPTFGNQDFFQQMPQVSEPTSFLLEPERTPEFGNTTPPPNLGGRSGRLNRTVEVRQPGVEASLDPGAYVEIIEDYGTTLRVRIWYRDSVETTVPRNQVSVEPGIARLDRYGSSRENIEYAPSTRPLWDERTGPVPSDVHQGMLGDCWLMSAMVALAQQRPRRIREIITPHTPPQPTSTYQVRLSLGSGSAEGPIRPVTESVSAWFPQLIGENEPRYAGERYPDGPLWPMLIEKAWAQNRRSFDNLNNNPTMVAMRALTGEAAPVPCAQTDPDQQTCVIPPEHCAPATPRSMAPDQLLAFLDSAHRQGRLITAETAHHSIAVTDVNIARREITLIDSNFSDRTLLYSVERFQNRFIHMSVL